MLKSEIELANTTAKLGRLEARYEALRNKTGGDEHVRELTMHSLKRYINQFKEEIARYNAHRSTPTVEPRRRERPVGLKNDRELANTREKLRELESRHAELRDDSTEDERVRRLTMRSLKRLINQLTEEIARYEAHQPARR